MMTSRWSLSRTFFVGALAFATAGCGDSSTAPGAALPPDAPLASTTYGATLLECPIDVTRSVTGTIDPTGGTLELDGHKLSVPLGALLLPTEFTLTVPASNYVEIDIKAAGGEHFQFEKPVGLTVSYSRCTRSNIDGKELRIYYIDSGSKTILEDLGGEDDKTARVVRTSTDHLSDYALGSP